MVSIPNRGVVLLVALLFEEEGEGDSFIVVSRQLSVVSVMAFNPDVGAFSFQLSAVSLFTDNPDVWR